MQTRPMCDCEDQSADVASEEGEMPLVGTGSWLSSGAESGTSNFDRELMEIEAEEHETIAQWLRGYYGSPVLAAQHEAKASNLRRQMEGANVRQPEDNTAICHGRAQP